MPSQEEYLDNLLQGISNKEELSEGTSADDILDFDAIKDIDEVDDRKDIVDTPDINDLEGISEVADINDLEGISEVADINGLEGISEVANINDLEGISEVANINDLEDISEVADINGLEGISEVADINGFEGISEAADLKNMMDISDVADTEDDVDDVSAMTLEDIESILEHNQHLTDEPLDSKFSTDLDELLSGESELESIHELLDKADRNELIDESILLNQNENSGTEIEDLLGEMENPAFAEEKAKANVKANKEEQKRLKEEKKAKKQAERLAAKQEKEAQKAAKKADKEAKKAEKKVSLFKKSKKPAVSEVVVPTVDEPEDIFLKEKEDISELLIKDDEEMADVDSLFSDIEAMGIMDENNSALEEELSELKEKTDTVDAISELLGGELTAEEASDLKDKEFILDPEEEDELNRIPEKNKPAKKKGLFAKILDFLMEEDEEEGERELILSEENENILREIDRSEDKKKKKGKKKPKKGKGAEDDENLDEESDDKKPKKEKKKPKKEKKPKLKPVEEPEKKLSKRRVSLIFLICLSFGAALLILVKVTNDYSDKQVAKLAYDEGDYKTCYQNLTGKYLNETEKIMYGKSESILRIKLWIREYELFVEEGNNEYALDSLIQAVHDYPTLYDYSTQWNAVSEVSVVYNEILSILLTKYNLTEEQAKSIAAEPNDIEYSRMIYTILDGGAFGSWDKEWKPEPEPEKPLDDLLPEESDIKNNNFIDTNK